MDHRANISRYQPADMRHKLSHQLVYQATLAQLDCLVKPDNVRTTLSSIMKYNYLPDFSLHINNMRSHVLGDELGLTDGRWPKGRLKVGFHTTLSNFQLIQMT